jgi:hypothetical protein
VFPVYVSYTSPPLSHVIPSSLSSSSLIAHPLVETDATRRFSTRRHVLWGITRLVH